jgi:hypothetical protein
MNAMAEIAALVIAVGVARQFEGIDLVAGVVGVGLVANVVEHKELGLRAKIHRVADAKPLNETLGALGNPARVAVIGLSRGRLEHVTGQDQGGLCIEGIDAGRGGVRHQVHVGFVDGLPAGDRGAIEHDAFREGVLIDRADVHRRVLPLAARIREAEVGVFHLVVLDQGQNVFGRRHRQATPFPARSQKDRSYPQAG